MDKEQIRKDILTFDVKPKETDVTVEAWLMRISLYGRIHYHHKLIGPDKDIDGVTNMGCFLDVMEKYHKAGRMLEWKHEKISPSAVEFYTEYTDGDRGPYQEQFIISVDLRPEVQKVLGIYDYEKEEKPKGIMGLIKQIFKL